MKENDSSSRLVSLKEWLAGSLKGALQGVVLAAAVGTAISTPAFGNEPDGFDRKDIAGFIDELVKDGGFSRTALEKVFKEVEYQPRIIELISKPAERRLTWWEYRNLFINDARIDQGVDFWIKNRSILEKASKDYGVSPAVIIGILGIETGFGRNSGGFRVVDALSTLGFGYPRRATFFKKELKEFLMLAKEQGFDPLELKGSYAGAMGIPQFMPSSYRAYAIDFDGNGQADIWQSPADAIGSIASYLNRHGWVEGKPVAAKASIRGQKYDGLLSDNPRPTRSVNEASQLGWQTIQVLPDSARVRGLKLDGKEGPEHWLTMTNFYVITRYNKSDLYAMAVWQLGSQVEKKLKARSGQTLARNE
ncbi:lytic murein transglycosylase B [Parendozoicomonas haliclonae]|uniref:Membrane-bound lytic murein transglycosylase B n=1 Tax=Parendozoicomonas haliclonae TaxID=1960125 RepID=A0A1X7AGP3_9GAMM|nr:lytic murein transglycosylase B [Parendozoicomonas haliclonae]SMA40421.1 Membrane-bound lytic murein transglycosylase B precursor [Parendozoicomonas haliclonae]